MSDESPEKSTNTKALPPYLSLLKLSELVKLLSTRNFTELKTNDLQNYGFAGTDAYVASAALKFLGVLDEKGAVIQEILKKFHFQGEPKKKALEDIIKSAYKKLFDRVSEPQNLEAEDLHNELLNAYGITPRIANTARPAFLWLCEQAGLKEPTIKIQNKKIEKKPVSQKPKEQGGNTRNSNSYQQSSLNTSTALNLPFTAGVILSIPTNENITRSFTSDEFKTMSDAIENYSKKFVEILPEKSDTQ